MTLAVYHLVEAPSHWVELLIAPSIVSMGLDNLLRARQISTSRAAIVFACGLLHGLGLAWSLTDAGLSGESRIISLVGFNLGVELGQILFVVSMLALLYLAKRIMPIAWYSTVVRGCPVLSVMIGAGWIIQRSLN